MGRRERLKREQDERGEELLFSSPLLLLPLSLLFLSLSTHFFGGRRTVLLCDFVRLCLQIKITPLINWRFMIVLSVLDFMIRHACAHTPAMRWSREQ